MLKGAVSYRGQRCRKPPVGDDDLCVASIRKTAEANFSKEGTPQFAGRQGGLMQSLWEQHCVVKFE